MDLEIIKTKTANQYLDFINLMNDNADLIDRFPNELSPLLRDLENKTDDLTYAKKVLETYVSIVEESDKNINRLLKIFQEMKEIQIILNPQNFSQ